MECPDLRRTHAHLSQGTKPSRKQTNIRDVKRYLQKVLIAKDGVLIVRNDDVSSTVRERIVVPRSILNGLLVSLHLKLDHPTSHQLKLVARRYFYALDMDTVVDEITLSCHICASLQQIKHKRVEQSTSDPPDGVCTQFAADVIRREKQFIFLLREVVTSYTWTAMIRDEQANSLRTALLKLCVSVRPIDGPKSVVRVDPAPGFRALEKDELLKSHNIILDVGRCKNVNKNPVAESGVGELEIELLKHNPSGGMVNELELATATARLNARIRSRGLSAREMLFQRDQFTNDQIPIADMDLITEQHQAKLKNHPYSERSKAPLKDGRPDTVVDVGDIVYVRNDGSKLKARDRYIIASSDDDWVYLRKFVGQQLRSNSYKVKRSECYKVPSLIPVKPPTPVMYDPIEDVDATGIGIGVDVRDVLRESIIPQGDSTVMSHPEMRVPNELHVSDNILPVQVQEPIPVEIIPQEHSQVQVEQRNRCSTRQRDPIERLEMNWSSKSYT